MGQIRVIDLWTYKVITQMVERLKSPFRIGNVAAGNYTQFGLDGRQSFHGVADLQFNVAQANPVWGPGVMFWDINEHCPAFYNDEAPDVKLNIGQETQLRVVNKAAGNVAITNGQVVYISGAQGQRPKVGLAIANDYAKAVRTIGMVTQASIATNLVGYTTTFGIVHDVDTSAFAAGDELWLSTTVAGGLQNTMPGTGFDRVRIGLCLTSHPTQGEIFFAPQIFETKFGDVVGGNYSEFESDGTLKFNGAASTFSDLLGSPTAVQVQGSGVSLNGIEQTVDFTTAARINDYVWTPYQLSHAWKLGSTIYPHIHWQQSAAALPNWLLQYRWQAHNAAKTTAWTNLVCQTNVFPYTSGTINQISHGASITPPVGSGLSDILQFRLVRDVINQSTLFAGVDPLNATASMISMDLHFETDTVGSRGEFTK